MSSSFNPDCNMALLVAAHESDFENVRKAVDEGADINCMTEDKWTPLLCSAKSDLEITAYLLERGADPNIASDRGYTPLMRAAGHGRRDIVELLLSAHADILARDFKGLTAYAMALDSGQQETIDCLDEPHTAALVHTLAADAARRDCVIRPLGPGEKAMISFTRRSVGGKVSRIDITFDDGTERKGITVYDELVYELPKEFSDKTIKSVGVPFEQG